MTEWTGGSAAIHAATSAVSRWFYLQLLWIAGIMLGGVLLGFLPASLVLLIAAKREVERRPMAASEAWSDYRRLFWRANILGVPIAAFLCIGLANLAVLMPSESQIDRLLLLATAATTFWAVYWGLNLWVRLAIAEEISPATVRAATKSILLEPKGSILIVTSVLLGCVVFLRFPAVALVTGGSLVAVLVMKIAMPGQANDARV